MRYITDSIDVRADDSVFDDVIEFIVERAARAGLSNEEQKQMRLAAEELFGNIIDHAYEDTGDVTVSAGQDDAGTDFVMSFCDHGVPFDPTAVSAPKAAESIKDLKVGGLGIFLAGELTDEMTYRYDGGNILTAVKYIKRQENRS